MFYIIPFIGVLLGIIGIGSGVILLPFFKTFLNLDFINAVYLTLLTTVIISFIGIVSANKEINYKIGFYYFIFSIIGSFLGSYFSAYISEFIKEGVLIGILLFILFFSNKIKNKKEDINKLLFLLLTIVTGFLTSLLGVGGGFLIIPVLMYFFHIDIKSAIKTSFFIIFLNTLSSLIMNLQINNGYSDLYNNLVNNQYLIYIILFGFIIGRFFSFHLSNKVINIIYKGFLIVSLCLTIYN